MLTTLVPVTMMPLFIVKFYITFTSIEINASGDVMYRCSTNKQNYTYASVDLPLMCEELLSYKTNLELIYSSITAVGSLFEINCQ